MRVRASVYGAVGSPSRTGGRPAALRRLRQQVERVDLDATGLGGLAGAAHGRPPRAAPRPAPRPSGAAGTRTSMRSCARRRPGGRPAPGRAAPRRPAGGRGEQVGDRLRRAGDAGHPGRRREAQLPALGQLPGGEPGRVPAQQRLHRRPARRRPPPRPARPRTPAGPAPPRPASGAASPRRPAGRPGSAAPRCRAAAPRRSRPRPPARRPAWRPPRPASRRHGGEHLVAPGRAHRRAGNARPSSSAVRRAPTTDARSRRPPQCGQA